MNNELAALAATIDRHTQLLERIADATERGNKIMLRALPKEERSAFLEEEVRALAQSVGRGIRQRTGR